MFRHGVDHGLSSLAGINHGPLKNGHHRMQLGLIIPCCQQYNLCWPSYISEFQICIYIYVCVCVCVCGNKMPTRSNRGFYCRSYCLLNLFRASLCPSSGAQDYYTVVASCGILCCSPSTNSSHHHNCRLLQRYFRDISLPVFSRKYSCGGCQLRWRPYQALLPSCSIESKT